MKAMFFDKTGTLTINEMRLHSVILNNVNTMSGATEGLIDLEHGKGHEQARDKNKGAHGLLIKNFACNHSLSYIKGQMLGDPMEDELFKYAHAGMIEDPDHDTEGSNGIKYFKKIRLNEVAGGISIVNMNTSPQEVTGSDTDLLHEAMKSSPMYVLGILDFKS